MAAVNDILVYGWVGSIQEWPEDKAAKKKRCVIFDIGHQWGPSRKQVSWFTCRAYSGIADVILDKIKLTKGDLIRVQGRLTSKKVEFSCGHTHRASDILVGRVYYVHGSNERPDKQYTDEPTGSYDSAKDPFDDGVEVPL